MQKYKPFRLNAYGLTKYKEHLVQSGLSFRKSEKILKRVHSMCQELQDELLDGRPLVLPYELGRIYYLVNKYKVKIKDGVPTPNRRKSHLYDGYIPGTLRDLVKLTYAHDFYPEKWHFHSKPFQLANFKFAKDLRSKVFQLNDELITKV